MTNRYTQIQFIAANYSKLQGLREVPIGMLVVFVSVWAMYNHGPTADLTAPILAVLGSALLYWLTGRYYDHTFGQVKPTLHQRNREAVSSIIFSVLGLLAFWLDTAVQIPVCALGLVFAGALLENFWRTTETVRNESIARFPENFTAASLILVVSILPVFGLKWWQAFGMESQVVSVFLVIGIVIILAGMWGHVRILRVLRLGKAK